MLNRNMKKSQPPFLFLQAFELKIPVLLRPDTKQKNNILRKGQFPAF